MLEPAEEWRDVPGFEGRYEVSDRGRVRSLRFRSNGQMRVMKATHNYAGYLVVSLGAKHKQFRVHCLVLEAFVGPRPVGMQGCHNDNDKDNCHLTNLRWDTPSGNTSDRRSYFGEGNPRAKLSNEQVLEIRRRGEGLRPRGFYRRLADEFGVTSVRVSQILKQ